MTRVYRVYGLTIASNCALPGTKYPAGTGEADVCFRLAQEPPNDISAHATEKIWYVSDSVDDRGQPNLQVAKLTSGWFRFTYSDGNDYFIENEGREVWGVYSPMSSPADNLSYFLGPVLGFVLRLRGIPCLHASAVTVANQAVAFVGDSGAGKSTMAAAFARLQFAVVADDILAIAQNNGKLFAQPGYPRVKLRPHSLDILDSVAAGLPALPRTPDGSRLHLDLVQHGYRFQPEPLNLAVVYILNVQCAVTPCQIKAMPPASALMALVRNSYANRLLDEQLRVAEFKELGRYARQVPIREIQHPADPASLSQLCSLILHDLNCFVPSGAGQTARLKSA